VIQFDTANAIGGVGQYGIIANSGSLNRFASDTATNNSAFDLDYTAGGTDSNTYSSNHSTNASPSKTYWHST
jgi:hypothetical protein